MTGTLTTIDTTAMLDLHFRGLQGMYFSEYIPRDNYVLLFSDLVEDSYYNYVTEVKTGLEQVLEKIRPEFTSRARRVAVYVVPTCRVDVESDAKKLGFKKWAGDAWMCWDNQEILHGSSTDDEIVIEWVGRENREQYVKAFHRAYAGDNSADPYANLPEYYSKSLLRSFDNTPQGYEVDYIWAKLGGEPVAVGCLISRDKMAGVYGVGTLKSERHRGIGASLMKHLCERAKAKGAKVFLQTEAGSHVESWYAKLGFKTLFVANYYLEG